MASCLAVTAIICVLITTVAVIVAFATPNWLNFDGQNNDKLSLCSCPSSCDCGLWLYCSGGSLTSTGSADNCKWFFSDDFLIEESLPDWFKATQGLMACALASSLLALFIGLFSLCCRCKSFNPNMVAGAFANLTFVLLAISVCVFGAKAHMEEKATVLTEQGNFVPIFGWSFWVGVGGAFMSLISSLLYFCVGRDDDYYM